MKPNTPTPETYHGDGIEIPVTVVNGDRDGPCMFLSAAVHGDEMNGVKIVQEVADKYEPGGLCGALVCLHVLNVPGFQAQQRYVPIYDQDLNRSFPGSLHGTTASRLAHTIYTEFVTACDLGLDFHTSTRNRTTMYHVRADMRDPDVGRIARAFGTNIILDGTGANGTLRSVANADDIPTVAVEMGRPHPFVEAGEPLFSIADHFMEDVTVVRAPSTGIVVGVLENAVAQPGHPLCHFASVDDETADIIRADIERGDFPVYRQGGFQLE